MWLTRPAVDLTNTFFPADCRLCGGPLLLLSQIPVCDQCRARLLPQDADPLCSHCGDALGLESARFAAAMGVTECTPCRLAPPEFTRAVAYAAYDDGTRDVLHLLKFSGVAAIARGLLAAGMGQAILKLAPETAGELLVVPVPLFAARERRRGYNQAVLLAQAGLAEVRRLRPEWRLELHPGLLRRVRDTRSSFTMAPHMRRANLRGAFRAGDTAVLKGRDILLIDDILTSGATARECARVLLRGGAARVWVATYARTFSEGRLGWEGVARWTGPAQATSAVHTASSPT